VMVSESQADSTRFLDGKGLLATPEEHELEVVSFGNVLLVTSSPPTGEAIRLHGDFQAFGWRTLLV